MIVFVKKTQQTLIRKLPVFSSLTFKRSRPTLRGRAKFNRAKSDLLKVDSNFHQHEYVSALLYFKHVLMRPSTNRGKVFSRIILSPLSRLFRVQTKTSNEFVLVSKVVTCNAHFSGTTKT